MSEEDDYYKKALNILRSICSSLKDGEKEEFETLLANYMAFSSEKKDYEGKQTFPITDYKTRN